MKPSDPPAPPTAAPGAVPTGKAPTAEAPPRPPDSPPTGLPPYPNLEKVINLQLPVIVVLAEKTATLEEVLSLCVGSVIVFKKHSTEPLDILVSNRRIGAGKTVKVGEHFGVHVRDIGSPEETLEMLR
jgi:flagellar motor switch protein FliN/FliY